MLRKLMLLHVIEDIPIGPTKKGAQRQAISDRIQHGHRVAQIGLAATDTTGPAAHLALIQGFFQRVNFAQSQIEIHVLLPACFPEATMQRFHAGR